jgi:tetratricopeptide (TPR) repeat protein
MGTLRVWSLMSMAILLLLIAPLSASAGVQYLTNSRDSQGRLIWTQPAYYPVGIIGSGLMAPDKNKTGSMVPSPMQAPKDVFIDKNDHIYVADTGNSRIVEFDPDGKWLHYLTVPESPLNKPEGLFITPNGDIYVADTGNKRVVRLNAEGKLLKEFKRPDSKLIPESFKYDPIKLVVDKRGFLYIATLGGYQGLLQLDPEGNFQSFYGANATSLTALDKLKKALYTKKMYANEISKLPGSISSVDIDADGFIYTTTSGNVMSNQVKKLNIRGNNLLAKDDGGNSRKFGESRPFEIRMSSAKGTSPQLIDLTVDINGNITVIDSQFKILSQYDANGNLLYFWGGLSADTTTQFGAMKNPNAIDSNSSGDLIVLDGQEGTLQRFRLSEFGQLVNKANQLTLQGRYEESEKPWQDVLHYVSYFMPALIGLGKAAYKKGDYELARHDYIEGGSHMGYSDAFWQIRLVWFQAHFSVIATTFIIAVTALLLFEKLSRQSLWRMAWRNRKQSTHPMIVQLKHAFTLLRYPIDGFTALRYENKGSIPSALIILALSYGAVCFIQIYTGFTFNYVDIHQLNLVVLFAEFMLFWFGWVVCNYLVSTILRGEGRFRDVFIASTYALIPLILVGIPLTILSMAMTSSEASIYNILWKCMLYWIVLMFFWKVQALQNYTVGETAVNIAFSAFAFLMLVVLIMITFGLTSDLRSFVYEVYQEVRLR